MHTLRTCWLAQLGFLAAVTLGSNVSRAADPLQQWQALSLGAPRASVSKSQVSGVRGSVWRPIGPAPLQGAGDANGRINSIAVNPYNPQEIYLGAAGGGVWRSRDFGASWTPLLDEQATLGIGEGSAIALDPFDTDTIYAGTSGRGTLNLSRGILKSTDGGGSWVVLGNDCPAGNSGNADDLFSSHDVFVIRVDPEDPNVLYLASDLGLFRSEDGGLNWSSGGDIGEARSLVVDPNSPLNARVLYAGVSQRGVMKSTDGGVTWVNSLVPPLPGLPAVTSSQVARVSVALVPRNPQIVYAALAGTNGAPDPMGIFVSTNGGATWQNRSSTFESPGQPDTQQGYALSLAVDPASPGDGENDVLLYGGTEQFRSTNGGGFFALTRNGLASGTHADWAFFQPDDGSPTHIYTGNDGGVWRTLDNGAHWTGTGLPDAPGTINAGALQVTLFHNLDSRNDANGSVTLGAVLNHGIARGTGSFAWSNSWPGEPADVVFDAVQLATAYALSGNATSGPCLRVLKSTDDGVTWTNDITPWTSSGETNCFRGALAVNPNHAGLLYAGGASNLWQTKDGGATWRIIASNGPITAIAVSRVNSNRVAYAVGNRVFVTTSALAASVASSNITRDLPGRAATRLAFDPNDANTVYVTLDGFGGGHVFRGTLNGSSWEDISPPIDLPVHALALDGAPTPTAIYVGTPLGVARSVDRGQSWTVLDNFHLPNVPVADLDLHAPSGRLLAATHGRGVFELKEPDGPIIALNAIDPETLFTNTSLSFGPVCVGAKKRITLQAFNAGNQDLEIFSLYRLMGSAAIRVVPNPSAPLVIGPNEEVDFTLEFSPTARGEQKAIVRVSSDDPTAPWIDVIVTGEGVAADLATVVADAGNFGSVGAGCGFLDLPLTINNPGSCDLIVSNIVSTNAQFLAPAAVTYPLVVNPGDSTIVWLRFQPTTSGSHSANYILSNNVPGVARHLVPVTGTGLPAQKLVSYVANSGNFGVVPDCEFRDLSLFINNQGNCDLFISNVLAGLTDAPAAKMSTNTKDTVFLGNRGASALSLGAAPCLPPGPRTNDWGDAPLPYPTLAENGGAFHPIAPGVALGIAVDGEGDGQPANVLATGDDVSNGDEDGLISITPNPLVAGATATMRVRASTPVGGLMWGWIDFDGDGTWAQGNEDLWPGGQSTVIIGTADYTFPFTVPANARPGRTYLRLRFTSDPTPIPGLNPTGAAFDGEVEDHAVVIAAPVLKTNIFVTNTIACRFVAPNIVAEPLRVHPGDTLELPVRFECSTSSVTNEVVTSEMVTNLPTPIATVTTVTIHRGAGRNEGEVTIVSNDPARTNTVPVHATGAEGQRIVTMIADNGFFGGVPTNGLHDLPLTINNRGQCDLLVDAIKTETRLGPASLTSLTCGVVNATQNVPPGGAFVTRFRFITNIFTGVFVPPNVVQEPLRVAPGDSVEVPIRFHWTNVTLTSTAFVAGVNNGGAAAFPADVSTTATIVRGLGLVNGTVMILNNDPSAPCVNVPVSALGLAVPAFPPGPGARPPRLAAAVPVDGAFGAVAAECEFRDQPLVLNNAGGSDLIISNIVTRPPFYAPSVFAYPLVIAPGDSIVLPVRFAPDDPGVFADTLDIFSNDPAVAGAVPPALRVPVSGFGLPAAEIVAFIADLGNFGRVPICEFRDLEISINNPGYCDLFITGLRSLDPAFVLPNAGAIDFPLVVHPGDTLHFPVRFQPATAGNFLGAILITNNVTAEPVQVGVQGVGLPGAGLNAFMADGGYFGEVPICEFRDLNITLNNTGYCDLVITGLRSSHPAFVLPNQFPIAGLLLSFPLVIRPGDSLELPIRFQPPAPGNYIGAITITNNATAPYQVGVQGTGLPRQRLATIVPDSGYFGAVAPCEFRDLPLTINNPGFCPLTIYSLYTLPNLVCCTNSSGSAVIINVTNVSDGVTNVTPVIADTNCASGPGGCLVTMFEIPSVYQFPLTIGPGDSLTLPIRFAPRTCCQRGTMPLGTNYGIVSIGSDDPASPVTFVTLHGVAKDYQRIATAVPDGGDFGDVPVYCRFADLPLLINNPGDCDLVISNIYSDDWQFLAPGTQTYPLVVHPGDSLEVWLRFAPTNTGFQFGNFYIINNAPDDSPHVVPVLGFGTVEQRLATAIADSGDFGVVDVGDFRDLPLTLNNSGTCPLVISNIYVEDDFAAFYAPDVMQFPLLIHPGDSLTVPIRFAPFFEGEYAATIVIESDDPRAPKFVEVAGAGSIAEPRVTINNFTFSPTLNVAGDLNLDFTLVNNTRYSIRSLVLGGNSSLVFLRPLIYLPRPLAPGQNIDLRALVRLQLPNLNFQNFNFGFPIELRFQAGGINFGPFRFTIPACIEIQNAVATPLDAADRNYNVRFTVVNRTASQLETLVLPTVPPGVTITQQLIRLPAPLAPGASATVSFNVSFATAAPNELCLDVVANSADCVQCCKVRHCFTLRSACASVRNQSSEYTPNGVRYGFNLANRSGVPVHFAVFDGAGGCLEFQPAVMPISPPLAPGETRRFTNNVVLNYNCTNSSFCYRLTLYDSNFTACCALTVCLRADNDEADLSVLKSAGTAAVALGETVTYFVRVMNSGPNTATNVTLTDELPPGAVFVTASDLYYYSVASRTITWQIGDVPVGMEVTRSVTARMTTTGWTTNLAIVTQPGYDPNLNNNTNRAEVEVTNAPPVDVSIQKTASAAQVREGDYVTFTITVDPGPGGAPQYVRVEDLLPWGFVPVEVRPMAGAAMPGLVLWESGPFTQPQTFTIVAQAVFPGRYTNKVEITSVLPGDLNDSNNQAATVVEVLPRLPADLSVTKTAHPASVAQGENVLFIVDVANIGSEAMTNIQVRDLLPPELRFVAASDAYGAVPFDPMSGLWIIERLEPGESRRLAVTATAQFAGMITNAASIVSSTPADSNMANNSSTSVVSVVTLEADVSVMKTADTNAVVTGSNVTFHVVVSNAGPSAARIDLRDVLPPGFTFLGADPGYSMLLPGWTLELAARTGTNLFIIGRAETAGVWTNTAEIVGSSVPDPNPANDRSSAMVTVTPAASADLSITKTANPSQVEPGGGVMFTLVLSNAGPDHATSVVVLDFLPPGFQYTGGDPRYNPFNGRWEVNFIGAGATDVLTITAQANVAADFYTNTAEIAESALYDPNPANNTKSAVVRVGNFGADLSVTKTAMPAAVNVGENFAYTVTFSNAGPSAAFNVAIVDTLPAGATFLGGNSTLGSCGLADNAFVCNVPSLGAGQSGTVTIMMRADSPGTLRNNVSISSDQNDPSPGNNMAFADVTVSAPAPTNRPPQFVGIVRGSNNVTMQFTAPAGTNYTVQYRNQIAVPPWIDLAVPQTAGTNVIVATDPGPLPPFRFYRLTLLASNPPLLTIAATAGANGSISPTGSVQRAAGANVQFTATPNAGYVPGIWSLNGAPVQTNGTTFTLMNLQSNAAVNVTFRAIGSSSNQFNNNTVLNIPDNNTAVERTVSVTNMAGSVTNVIVEFHCLHGSVNDLTADLIAPDNTTITLLTAVPNDGANFGTSCSQRTRIADGPYPVIASGTPPYVGTYRGIGSLAAFNARTGAQLNGTWRLRFRDSVAGTAGSLRCWSLIVMTTP